MTFSKWNEIRVTVLFKWWHTDNVGEYILTLFAIIAMSIVYQSIRTAHVREVLKCHRRTCHDSDSAVDISVDLTQPLTQKEVEKGKSSMYVAAFGTVSYGFGLLLMFVVSVSFPPT